MRRNASAILMGLLLALAVVTTASAKEGPPGIMEEPTEGANNLSVPAVFVPSVGVGSPVCTAADDTILPDPAEMSTLFPGYYIQGEATWQADCETAAADSVTVTTEWGDNLQSAPLKQGTPIRVEMGLVANASEFPMTGFTVVKLTDELDRLATYGTTGVPVTPYPEVRVWNAGATLKIFNADRTVYDGPFTAELNSTGRIVYGYNWQKPIAGTYTIVFHAPSVKFGATDGGTLIDSDSDGDFDTVSLTVNVAASAGGGKGGGGGGNGPGGPRQ